MFTWIYQFHIKDVQAFQFLARSYLTFLQITSDYLVPRFLRLSSGETNTNLEGLTFPRKNIIFHYFQMARPLGFLLCMHFLILISFSPVISSF